MICLKTFYFLDEDFNLFFEKANYDKCIGYCNYPDKLIQVNAGIVVGNEVI